MYASRVRWRPLDYLLAAAFLAGGLFLLAKLQFLRRDVRSGKAAAQRSLDPLAPK